MPSEPAMAVSTAMRILRIETHPQDPLSPLDSSPSMGSAEFDAFLLVIDINVLDFKDKYFGYLPTPQVLPIEGEIPEGRGGLPYFIASEEMRLSWNPLAMSFLSFTSGRKTMRWLFTMDEGEKFSCAITSRG